MKPSLFKSKSLTGDAVTAAVIVILGLAISSVAAWRTHKQIEHDNLASFHEAAGSLTEEIISRFQHPLHGLQSIKAIYTAKQNVNRAEFRAFVTDLARDNAFLGVRGLGFIQHVTPQNFDAFLSVERADNAPLFAFRQLQDQRHSDFYIIKFIEPAANNKGAQGLDVGSESLRRAAAQRAIDTGEPSITAGITLIQDQGKTPGVLMFLPIYAGAVQPTNINERRAALRGLAYAPIVIGELLAGLHDVSNGLLDFELYDAPQETPHRTLLYANAPVSNPSKEAPHAAAHHFSEWRSLRLNGRELSVRVNSSAAFDAQLDHRTPWLVLLGGALFSALIARLLWQQSTGRQRAENLAQQITAKLRAEASARELSEVALRESEFRWRFAIDGAGDGLWDWNVPQSTVFFSPQWKRMLGFDQADIGSSLDEWSKRVHPDDLANVMSEVTAHLDGLSTIYANEHRVSCKDGSWKWILDRGMVVERDAAGKPLRVIGTHTDISERKQIEAALIHSELTARTAGEHAQALLDQLQLQKYALDQHAIVATADVQGKITYVNDKFCEISGYTADELIGQDHVLLNSGTHPHGFFKSMYRTVTQGDVWQGEVCNRAKDGRLYWVSTTIVPVLDSRGKPEQYIAIRTDISERKKTEQALQDYQQNLESMVKQQTEAAMQSEQHLRTVFHTSLDAIIGMDAQGRVTEWNPQAEETFGWSFSEAVGGNLHEMIIPPRHHESHLAGLARYLATGTSTIIGKRIDVAALRRDGSEFPAELTIAPIVTADRTSFSAFLRDVTQRKKDEVSLKRLIELAQAANRAKSDFLANMSHEIRTPMNGVIGMIDILQSTQLEPSQQRMLDTVHISALALLSILNDILDYSKIEAGKLDVEHIPTHLREVAEGVAQLMSASASAKRVELSVFISPELPTWIY